MIPNPSAYYGTYQPVGAQPAPEKPATKNRRLRRVSRERYLLAIKVWTLVFILSLATVYDYAQGALLGYQVVDLKKEIQALQTDNKALELQIAELSSLDRVEKVAVNELGMVRPNDGMMVAMAAPAAPVQVASVQEDRDDHRVTGLAALYQVFERLVAGQERVGMKN